MHVEAERAFLVTSKVISLNSDAGRVQCVCSKATAIPPGFCTKQL